MAEVFGNPRDRFINYALTNAARVLRHYWQPLASAGGWDVAPELRRLVEGSAGLAQAERHPGQGVYERLCSNCHQPDGRGLANIYPPLAGNPRVAGDPEVLIRMVLHGVRGPMRRNGVIFNNVMPPSGLNDRQVADVLSFLRSQFGNEADAVPASRVRAVRETHANRILPWDAAALEALETSKPGNP
jgi:mono/diheme cytochrome c family protein